MKKILVLTHDASEGLGTFGDFLKSSQVRTYTVRLFEGGKLPGNLEKFDGIVVMGGPMSVYDEAVYPFLSAETKFLSEATEANVPILGICLGAQLIAKACNVQVEKAPVSEVGWKQIHVTEEGRRDILLQGLPERLHVFQWHEDAFEVPHGGILLVTGDECRNQAFRYGNAYGLQFHLEVTQNMLEDWFPDHTVQEIYVRTFKKIEYEYSMYARMIYSNFMWLLDLYQQSRRHRSKRSSRVWSGGYGDVWNRRNN